MKYIRIKDWNGFVLSLQRKNIANICDNQKINNCKKLPNGFDKKNDSF